MMSWSKSFISLFKMSTSFIEKSAKQKSELMKYSVGLFGLTNSFNIDNL